LTAEVRDIVSEGEKSRAVNTQSGHRDFEVRRGSYKTVVTKKS